MTVEDLRFARKVERLCRLGTRPIFELLREVAAERLLRQPLEAKVDDFLARFESIGGRQTLDLFDANDPIRPPLRVVARR